MPASATCDLKKNILYITLDGSVCKRELDSLYRDIRFCVADLQPEFNVINDLSNCTFGHLNGIPVFKKIMNYLKENKVQKVIRVTGERKLILKQIIRICKSFQAYNVQYAESLEEAKLLLEDQAMEQMG